MKRFEASIIEKKVSFKDESRGTFSGLKRHKNILVTRYQSLHLTVTVRCPRSFGNSTILSTNLIFSPASPPFSVEGWWCERLFAASIVLDGHQVTEKSVFLQW